MKPKPESDDLRPEYNLEKLLNDGEIGKYADRCKPDKGPKKPAPKDR